MPRNFPVGRLRLSRSLSDGMRRRHIGLGRPSPLLSRYGGPPPKWKGSIQATVSQIAARGRGAISEFAASRQTPRNIHAPFPGAAPATAANPGQAPPEAAEHASVARETGAVREIGLDRAASEGSAGEKTAIITAAHEAIQGGMRVARRMIWKHMSPGQKAKRLLSKMMDQVRSGLV